MENKDTVYIDTDTTNVAKKKNQSHVYWYDTCYFILFNGLFPTGRNRTNFAKIFLAPLMIIGCADSPADVYRQQKENLNLYLKTMGKLQQTSDSSTTDKEVLNNLVDELISILPNAGPKTADDKSVLNGMRISKTTTYQNTRNYFSFLLYGLEHGTLDNDVQLLEMLYRQEMYYIFRSKHSDMLPKLQRMLIELREKGVQTLPEQEEASNAGVIFLKLLLREGWDNASEREKRKYFQMMKQLGLLSDSELEQSDPSVGRVYLPIQPLTALCAELYKQKLSPEIGWDLFELLRQLPKKQRKQQLNMLYDAVKASTQECHKQGGRALDNGDLDLYNQLQKPMESLTQLLQQIRNGQENSKD